MREYEKVYGYVLDDQGMHNGNQKIDGSPASMVEFILEHRDADCIITGTDDVFLVSSMQGFLDQCYSRSLLKDLQKEYLAKYTSLNKITNTEQKPNKILIVFCDQHHAKKMWIEPTEEQIRELLNGRFNIDFLTEDEDLVSLTNIRKDYSDNPKDGCEIKLRFDEQEHYRGLSEVEADEFIWSHEKYIDDVRKMMQYWNQSQ